MLDSDKVNILIVDDLPDKTLVLQSILEELGQNIVVAHTGEDALRCLLAQDFAVILLDVNMPGMDGFETASYIRRRRRSAYTPIIFITAYADDVHTAQGYALGAVDFILSPVMPGVLRSKVKVFVELFQLTKQLQRQADERVALAEEQAARAAAEEATRRSKFLAEASRDLASSLEFESRFRALSRLVVPFLADLGAVVRIDERQHWLQIDMSWIDSRGHIQSRMTRERGEVPVAFMDALKSALASENATTFTELGTWPLRLTSPRPQNQMLADDKTGVMEFPMRSAAFVPLVPRGRMLGMLALIRRDPLRIWSPADVAFAEVFADRSATLLDNARLYHEIREGDRRKNEFLAMLAHELRNPLAPIRNAVHVFRLMGLKEPTLIQVRDMIDRQVTHMARLIDDLLDMSRLSRGKILLRKERVDLKRIVRDAVEDHRSTLEAAGLTLNVTLPDRSLFSHADPVRLAQVVGNILHNASKFTDPGGSVTVSMSVDSDGRTVRIVVRDTGIGMDHDILARLFDAFTQADRSLDRSRGGMGLGLALVKGLVELHEGTVQAFSAGPGTGTEITVLLPVQDQDARAGSNVASAPAGDKSARVLVIEDNLDTANSMRMLLSLAGHPVEVAHDGPQGIEAARRFQPAVVLCDLGLPGGMDGCGVARELRQDPAFAKTHLIALTGYGQGEDRDRCLEAGFDNHLTKPIDFSELESALAMAPAGHSLAPTCPSSAPLL